MKQVCIIIPVKDEETGVKFLFQDYQKCIMAKKYDISFIFVIDARTSDASREASAKFGQLIINQSDTHGKGAAVRQALNSWNKNKTEFVIFMDADGSYSFSDVYKIIKSLEKGADVASGSRFLSNKLDSKEMGGLHFFGNRVLSKIASIKNRRKISDLCTGLWGFSSHSLSVMNIKSSGFDLEAEITGRCSKLNLKHREVAVNWNARKGGVSKLRSFRDGFIILIRILRT